jgi:hypothetical protein
MADEYISAPIEFDENLLYNTGVERIQSYFPGWVPRPNGFTDLLLRGVAAMASVEAEVASDVPFSIFRAFGPLAHDPAIDATPATVQSIWTAIDQQGGYEIASGTPVGLSLSTSTTPPVGFETVGDYVIPNGEQTVQIMLVATVPGQNTSGLDTVIRADSLTYITSVTLNGVSAGGNDAELDDDYVNRLSNDFETWTTTPIRGPDFARKACDIAGVYRCAYWENYNPVDATTDNDKYVALCPIDQAGSAVSSGTQTQVETYIESLREVNFVAPVVSPDYSSIDVTAEVHVADPNNQSVAIANATTAIQSFLNAATWGAPPSGQSPVWQNTPIIRYSKVMTVIETADYVEYADNMTINITGSAAGTADITMPGSFPLPTVGTITVTAVSP